MRRQLDYHTEACPRRARATYRRGRYVLPDISVFAQTGETSPPAAVSRFYVPKAGIRLARSGHAEFE